MPRPSKLTPATADSIVEALELGATMKAAAASAGVSETAFHRWQMDERPMYRKFRERTTRARESAVCEGRAEVVHGRHRVESSARTRAPRPAGSLRPAGPHLPGPRVFSRRARGRVRRSNRQEAKGGEDGDNGTALNPRHAIHVGTKAGDFRLEICLGGELAAIGAGCIADCVHDGFGLAFVDAGIALRDDGGRECRRVRPWPLF